MSGLARAQTSNLVNHVPPVRDRGRNVHTFHVASATSSNSHGAPTQRSFPLFRVMPSRNPATRADRDSQRIDVQQASPLEQPVAHAPERDACVVATPAPPASSRRQLWSAASVASLCADYPTAKLVRDIGAEQGRSVGAVYGKARRLGLKRPRRGSAPGRAVVALPVPALVPDTPQPGAASAPERLPPKLPVSQPTLPIPQPTLPTLPPPPAPKAERTKMGGRQGRWTKDDGALSERLERLFIANFSPGCIAAVLDVTERAAATRAWVVNCPRRDPQALRHDVEAARLVDRQAAPLPRELHSWKTGKMLVRKRCSRKGHFIWGTSGTRLSNDARRQRSYKILTASAPLHAW